MADLFSDHYSASVSQAAVDDPRIKVASGIDHSALRYKRGTITVTTATAGGDVLRFFPMKSGDRLINLFISHTVDASTSGDANCGLHRSTENGENGSVIDIDLFCDILIAPMDDITAVMSRIDLLPLSTELELEDVGKQLFVMADEGGGTFPVNPFEAWDVTITIANEVGIVASEYVLEAVYTSTGN